MSEKPNHLDSHVGAESHSRVPMKPKTIGKIRDFVRGLIMFGALGVAPVAGLEGCATTPQVGPPVASAKVELNPDIQDWNAKLLKLSSTLPLDQSAILAHHATRPSKPIDIEDDQRKKIDTVVTFRGDLDASSGPIDLQKLKPLDAGWEYELGVSKIDSKVAAIGSMQIVGNLLQVRAKAKVPKGTYPLPILEMPKDHNVLPRRGKITLEVGENVQLQPAEFTQGSGTTKNFYTKGTESSVAAIGSNDLILASLLPHVHTSFRLSKAPQLPQGVELVGNDIVLKPGNSLPAGTVLRGNIQTVCDDAGVNPLETDFSITILKLDVPKVPELLGPDKAKASLALSSNNTSDLTIASVNTQSDVAYTISSITISGKAVDPSNFSITNSGQIIIPNGKNPDPGTYTLKVTAAHLSDSTKTSSADITLELRRKVEPIDLLSGDYRGFNTCRAGTLLAQFTPQDKVSVTAMLQKEGDAAPSSNDVEIRGDKVLAKANLPKGTHVVTVTASNGQSTENQEEIITITVHK